MLARLAYSFAKDLLDQLRHAKENFRSLRHERFAFGVRQLIVAVCPGLFVSPATTATDSGEYITTTATMRETE